MDKKMPLQSTDTSAEKPKRVTSRSTGKPAAKKTRRSGTGGKPVVDKSREKGKNKDSIGYVRRSFSLYLDYETARELKATFKRQTDGAGHRVIEGYITDIIKDHLNAE